MNIPYRIKKYLNDRGISDEVILEAQIGWDDLQRKISIPVFDMKGNFLFNKYRRDPDTNYGPKYTYDRGSTSSLYGFSKNDSPFVIITEGELDALVLKSRGVFAVSSTGGSGTFRKEWSDFFRGEFEKEVYICYDTDDAGVRGAINVQTVLPEARIIWLPKMENGKDVTDFLSNHTIEDFFKVSSRRYDLPFEPEVMDQKEMKKVSKLYDAFANDVLTDQRELKSRGEDYRHTELLIEYANERSEYLQKQLLPKRTPRTEDVDLLRNAKMMPIHQMIQFNHQAFARCIFHEEKTPSMKYYPEKNRVHCFSCGKGGDAIDVKMQLEGIPFGEAIKKLQ